MKERHKEMLKNFASFLAICGFMLVFWVTLFYGICDEAERRANQKSNRKWLHEKALNQYQTENQPELMKAIRMAQEAK